MSKSDTRHISSAIRCRIYRNGKNAITVPALPGCVVKTCSDRIDILTTRRESDAGTSGSHASVSQSIHITPPYGYIEVKRYWPSLWHCFSRAPLALQVLLLDAEAVGVASEEVRAG
jgi:hypothetical protein